MATEPQSPDDNVDLEAAGESSKSPQQVDEDIPEVDIDDDPDWEHPPIVTFDQRASLQIAWWVLAIFSGVYLLSFGLAFTIIQFDSATFDGAAELLKFLLSSILPLVTLAVGIIWGIEAVTQVSRSPAAERSIADSDKRITACGAATDAG